MNQPTLYSYSILSGVWNDLDYDVILLVKEYLRIHLNRKLLQKDYNIFLENIKKNTRPELLGDGPGEGGGYMNSIRYGFTTHIRQIEHTYEFEYKYYLLNTELPLYIAPCYGTIYGNGLDHIRSRFVHNFQVKLIGNNHIEHNFNNDKERSLYIRRLMVIEEGLINETLEPGSLVSLDLNKW